MALVEFSGDGELEDLRWVSRSDMQNLEVAEVTHLVLGEAIKQMDSGQGERPIALFRWIGRNERPGFRQAVELEPSYV